MYDYLECGNKYSIRVNYEDDIYYTIKCNDYLITYDRYSPLLLLNSGAYVRFNKILVYSHIKNNWRFY